MQLKIIYDNCKAHPKHISFDWNEFDSVFVSYWEHTKRVWVQLLEYTSYYYQYKTSRLVLYSFRTRFRYKQYEPSTESNSSKSKLVYSWFFYFKIRLKMGKSLKLNKLVFFTIFGEKIKRRKDRSQQKRILW